MPRRPLKFRFVAAVCGAWIACLAGCGLAQPAADGAAAPRKLLLMHYMPWYETPAVRGQWGGHWTGHQRQHDPDTLADDGRPDIWSHYDPLIGLYDSADPDVLECQLLQMKLAGIDGVIVDWYGISAAADYPPIHDATRALFDRAGRLGMKFAACFEDRTVQYQVEHGHLAPDEIDGHMAETFSWMDDAWFHAPHYVRVDGRPLVLNFGPIYVKDAPTWDRALSAASPRPKLFALHHLWKGIDADGGFTWVHPKAWEGDPDPATAVANLQREHFWTTKDPAQMIPSATPGFRDVYANPHATIEHREGQTLRESLEAAMTGPWPIVQLVTWNDYGEGTMIEPTHQFGYTFLEIIQTSVREQRGDTFAFTAADLRLPARLLELKKAGNTSPESLDRIADLLAQGRCEEARAALASLDTD